MRKRDRAVKSGLVLGQNGDEAVGCRRMLKRGGKSSYNPYSTTQRVKKPEWKDRLDILPNRHSVWLKQVGQKVQMVFSFFRCKSSTAAEPRWLLVFCPVHHTRAEALRNATQDLVKVCESMFLLRPKGTGAAEV